MANDPIPSPRIDPATRRATRPVRRWAYVLLVVPFVGTLWVSTYAKSTPRLFGFPFFYWYQFAWVIAGAAITALVYLVTTPRRSGGTPAPTRDPDVPPGAPADPLQSREPGRHAR
jgi:hypothetical protein